MKKSCASGFPRMSLLGQSCCQSRAGTSRCLHRCMNVAWGRGRYDTESLTERDSNAFIRFQPQASPPSPRAPLAPLRDDVPLTEPHSGLLSLSDTFPHTVCSAAPWDPRAERHPAHTPAFGPAAGTRHTSASKPRESRLELTDRKCNIGSLLCFCLHSQIVPAARLITVYINTLTLIPYSFYSTRSYCTHRLV